MTDDCTPKCPRCHSARRVITSGTTMRAWWCHKCQIEFEPEDDSDIGYGPPDKRMIREEKRSLRRGKNTVREV
jgi:transposase-like protein